MRNKDIDVTDFVVASVAPIIYAQIKSPFLFDKFLKTLLNSPQDESLYTSFFLLKALLHSVFTNLHSKFVQYLCFQFRAKYRQYTVLSQEASRLQVEFKKMSFEDKTSPDEDENLELISKKYHQALECSYVAKSLGRELLETYSDVHKELNLFFDRVQWVCTSWCNNIGALRAYLNPRKSLKKVLIDNADTFNKLTNRFIIFILQLKLPIMRCPLPLYLCPYDAGDKKFSYNIKEKRISHLSEVLRKTKVEETPLLRAKIIYIQNLQKLLSAPKAGKNPHRLFTPKKYKSLENEAPKPCRRHSI